MKKLFKKADFILIIVCFLLAFAFFLPRLDRGKELRAVITCGGKEYRAIELNKVEAAYTLEPECSPAVVIRVEKGAIGFVKADCPNKLCVKSGMLTRSGQTAVCLPAKTVITISGGQKQADEPAVITY